MISWLVGLSIVLAVVAYFLTWNRSAMGWLPIATYTYSYLAFGYFILIAFGLISVYPTWLQPTWLGVSPSEVVMLAAFLGAIIGDAKKWWLGVLALVAIEGLGWAIQYHLTSHYVLPTGFLLSTFGTVAGLVVRGEKGERPTDLQTIAQDLVGKVFLGAFGILLVLYVLWLMMYLAGGHL